nr:ATP-dependent DNA ligase [Actinoplanes digitatis]
MGFVQFLDLAATSAAVSATSGRKAKIDLLAAALRRLDPAELAAGSAYLAGELRQRQTGVGYAGLRDRPAPAAEPTLTVAEVDARIAEISVVSGVGSQARRRELLAGLFGRATADEQRLLVGLFSGELRQGAQAGLLADAIARAAEVPIAEVRRALLLSGDLKQVAVAALTGGSAALAEFSLRVGTPLTPMLASSAPDVGAALLATGAPATVDVKLDGIRIQVHRSGDEVAVFTRSLDDITSRLPDVVAAVRTLPAREIVLDGEAMALDARGRPRPFQETSSRAATRGARRGGEAGPSAGPALVPYFFDLLHLDGTDLLDEPGRVRWAALADALPAGLIVGRRTVETEEQAAEAFAAALAADQEGIVVKAQEAPYDVGRRGAAWVKVKPRHTLDLVVLAVEWGHGLAPGLAVQPAPRCPGPAHRRVRDARQDLQGPHRRVAALADRAVQGAGDRRLRLGGHGPTRTGGGDRLRRGADLAALSRWRGAAVRPGAALPRRQARGGGGHDRHGQSPRNARDPGRLN